MIKFNELRKNLYFKVSEQIVVIDQVDSEDKIFVRRLVNKQKQIQIHKVTFSELRELEFSMQLLKENNLFEIKEDQNKNLQLSIKGKNIIVACDNEKVISSIHFNEIDFPSRDFPNLKHRNCNFAHELQLAEEELAIQLDNVIKRDL